MSTPSMHDDLVERLRAAITDPRHPIECSPLHMASAQAITALQARISELESASQWRPIETAPSKDGWIYPCLFGKRREWGWECWVGQCDDGHFWLGRQGNGSCFGTDVPTHWRPLPPPPPQSQERESGKES